MNTVKVGRHTIELTNLSKVFFPKEHITKEDIIQYYLDIADTMIPYIKNRPIAMQRFPNGIRGEGFFQKDMPEYFPHWIKSVTVKKQSDGTVRYVLCNDAATLIYLANQGSLTLHIWLSKADKLDYPDRMIFDLDPSKNDFASVKKAAFLFKEMLESLGLVPFAMLTGSRGIHVVVPLKRRQSFDEVRDFARDIAQLFVNEHPRMLTLEVRKAKRRGRIFVDVLRNALGQTGVAPYAVRAIPGAPVATPITWQELRTTRSSQRYTIHTVLKRLAQKGDPWNNMNASAQSLVRARRKLNNLLAE